MRGCSPRAPLLLLCALPLVPAAACSFSSPNGGGGGGDDDGGGSGAIDAAPPCADGDADGDTVCNATDQCPGQDDRQDADADAVPDGCDDWPCGPKPGDPGDPMNDGDFDGRGWRASNITIGMSRRLVVTAGQPYSARFGWGVLVFCPQSSSCQAQVEVGHGATRTGCIFDNTISEGQVFTGTFNDLLTAPATPGVHELRLNAGRRSSCGDSTQPWYGGDPGSDSTIAILCVQP